VHTDSIGAEWAEPSTTLSFSGLGDGLQISGELPGIKIVISWSMFEGSTLTVPEYAIMTIDSQGTRQATK